MLFYFVRHGQTEANVRQILAGSGQDHTLTPEGRGQALQLARSLKDMVSHPIHRIVASHLTRARETAEYLSAELAVAVEVDNRWREWDLGEWEGKPYADYAHLMLGEGEPAQGEGRSAFYTRVGEAWKDLRLEGRTCLVVSHGGVWLALQDVLGIPRFKVSNCSLVRVEMVDGAWRARILNP